MGPFRVHTTMQELCWLPKWAWKWPCRPGPMKWWHKSIYWNYPKITIVEIHLIVDEFALLLQYFLPEAAPRNQNLLSQSLHHIFFGVHFLNWLINSLLKILQKQSTFFYNLLMLWYSWIGLKKWLIVKLGMLICFEPIKYFFSSLIGVNVISWYLNVS